MYHRIDRRRASDDARLCVTPSEFAVHLDWLARRGYVPCRISEFEGWLAGRAPLRPSSVLITFDDGYRGVHEHAMPLLGARGWPATVFLVSGLLGQTDRWSGAEGTRELLSTSHLAEMAQQGFEFQSHSHTHADLTRVDDDQLSSELSTSRQTLQELLGRPVDYFAYPYGRFDERVRDAVAKAGYRLGFSVLSGFNRPGTDRLAIRRLDIVGYDTRKRFGRKVQLGSNNGSVAETLRYLVRRTIARA